jgi:hypothetical protein
LISNREGCNNNNNNIIKTNYSTSTTKVKWTGLVTAILAIFLISTSAISMPAYGQARQNTLKVITQVVCPQGFTCPSPSQTTITIQGNNPIPSSSFAGSSSGVDVTLGDGSYSIASWSTPATPTGLVLYPGFSPLCRGIIGGGQSLSCTVLFAFAVNVDADGDGIPDSWETNGIPYVGTGGAVQNYILPGANSLHKNLYVEVDYMQFHKPSALGDVRTSFSNAPVSNPDGINGINLRTDIDEQTPHQSITNINDLLNTIKPKWFGTATERADPNHDSLLAAKSIVYRYAVFGHDQPVISSTCCAGSSGVADGTPGMNFLVTLGAQGYATNSTTGHPVGSPDQQEATFMHELGHNLGLTHSGGSDGINCKNNYFSVMNYLFQFRDNVASRPLDYSRSALATLDKNNLNEQNGISQSNPPGLITIYGPTGLGVTRGPGFSAAGIPIDWNFNERFTDVGVIADINRGFPGCGTDMNGNGPGPILNGFNDWPAIKYLFNSFPSRQATGIQQQLVNQQQTSPVEHELTINDIRQSRLELLEGILDAFERFISAPPSSKLVAFKQLVFEIQNFKAALRSEEFSTSPSSLTATAITPTPSTTTPTTTNIPTMTTHIAQLLKTDQLDAAIGELNNLLAQVITLSSSYQSQQQQLPQQQQQQSNSGDNLP